MDMKALWNLIDQAAWDYAEGPLYDSKVKKANVELERRLEREGLRDEIAAKETEEFLSWLRDQYFPWKFTGPEIVQNRRYLASHWADGSVGMAKLERARVILIAPNGRTKETMIKAICEIQGLNVAAASGLLALTYPETFGCVDINVVKSFHQIGMFSDILVKTSTVKDRLGTPKLKEYVNINARQAERMMDVMAVKAKELNAAFGNINKWKPRSIDRVLWAVRGRSFDPENALP